MYRFNFPPRTAAMQTGKPISYKLGSTFLIPKSQRVGKKLAIRGFPDMSIAEKSHRTYRPQKHFFNVPTPHPSEKVSVDKEFILKRSEQDGQYFHAVEHPIVETAFHTPELISMKLADAVISGLGTRLRRDIVTPELAEDICFWLQECRYWRCLGISQPFLTKFVPRAHCWKNNGEDVGSMVMSAANLDAIMDLERALKRKEMGLSPNYAWDKWGPTGMIDGSKPDYLPRFRYNAHKDPDGVDVVAADILPYTTHDQLKERYAEFISAEDLVEQFQGSFLTPTSGGITVADLGDGSLVDFYVALKKGDGVREEDINLSDPTDMRVLILLATNDEFAQQLGSAEKWSQVLAALEDVLPDLLQKVEFARILRNTRDDPTRVRRFYEEKCNFDDFMTTPDKEITAAVIAYWLEVKQVLELREWAQPMMNCKSDLERQAIMGPEAFAVYRTLEDSILDFRRRKWSTRFNGEANEEKTLDYMLENFGRRTEKPHAGRANITGEEFDREFEPIGRNVQRRIIGADKSMDDIDMDAKRKGMFKSKTSLDPFARLHKQQLHTHRGFGVH